SLLYTFLPYHLFRGPFHLFLAAYYLVPPMVMVVLWVYLDEIPWFGRTAREMEGGSQRSPRRLAGALLLGLLVACAGIYYACFACFFLLIAGLASCFQRRRFYPLALAGTLIRVVVVGVLVNVAPTLLYRWEHGPNPEAVVRDPGLVETLGLKVVQL